MGDVGNQDNALARNLHHDKGHRWGGLNISCSQLDFWNIPVTSIDTESRKLGQYLLKCHEFIETKVYRNKKKTFLAGSETKWNGEMVYHVSRYPKNNGIRRKTHFNQWCTDIMAWHLAVMNRYSRRFSVFFRSIDNFILDTDEMTYRGTQNQRLLVRNSIELPLHDCTFHWSNCEKQISTTNYPVL